MERSKEVHTDMQDINMWLFILEHTFETQNFFILTPLTPFLKIIIIRWDLLPDQPQPRSRVGRIDWSHLCLRQCSCCSHAHRWLCWDRYRSNGCKLDASRSRSMRLDRKSSPMIQKPLWFSRRAELPWWTELMTSGSLGLSLSHVFSVSQWLEWRGSRRLAPVVLVKQISDL